MWIFARTAGDAAHLSSVEQFEGAKWRLAKRKFIRTLEPEMQRIACLGGFTPSTPLSQPVASIDPAGIATSTLSATTSQSLESNSESDPLPLPPPTVAADALLVSVKSDSTSTVHTTTTTTNNNITDSTNTGRRGLVRRVSWSSQLDIKHFTSDSPVAQGGEPKEAGLSSAAAADPTPSAAGAQPSSPSETCSDSNQSSPPPPDSAPTSNSTLSPLGPSSPSITTRRSNSPPVAPPLEVFTSITFREEVRLVSIRHIHPHHLFHHRIITIIIVVIIIIITHCCFMGRLDAV